MRIVSRQQAIAEGLTRYFTGERCKRGHVAERNVRNLTCAECKRIADRKQYLKDPQKFIRKAKAYAEANPERSREYANRSNTRRRDYRLNYYRQHAERKRAYSLEWYAKNIERAKVAYQAWNAANRDKCRAYSRNRRARFRAAEGRHTADDVAAIFAAQRGKCAACRKSVRGDYHVDHITPLIEGGSNWPSNLQILCPRCNLQKNRRDPVEFMQSRGFLL